MAPQQTPGASQNLYLISCHVLWRELCRFAAASPHVFLFHFLKQGLHDTPDILRTELQNAIDHAPEQSGAILLGYGLCSNGLAGIQARNAPLVIMRGHDCITFLLGSRQRYQDYFDNHPGTYWYSPGWIDTNDQPSQDRYDRTLRQYIETYGEDNAQYLMEATENWVKCYNTAAYIDLGIGGASQHKAFTRQCAQSLGWHYDELQGDPQLMTDFVNGNWDDDRFLIVPPGHRIAPSHDESIICAQP